MTVHRTEKDRYGTKWPYQSVTPLVHSEDMASAQLQLIENEESWKLDARTIEVGRAGLAAARAALANARTAPAPAETHNGQLAMVLDRAA